jgi:hypothetical protein
MTLPFSQDSNEFMLTELLLHNSTMEDGIYRYRISSPLSTGHLQSLKLQLRWRSLTTARLKYKFGLHRFLCNRTPTALVSTTKDMVRALKGAYDEHYVKLQDMKGVYLTIINAPTQALREGGP